MTVVSASTLRIPYRVNRGSGYSNPDYRWRWGCPVCELSCEEKERADCQRRADEHRCEAGWCPVPNSITCHPDFGRLAARLQPTPDDRARWDQLRERKRRRG